MVPYRATSVVVTRCPVALIPAPRAALWQAGSPLPLGSGPVAVLSAEGSFPPFTGRLLGTHEPSLFLLGWFLQLHSKHKVFFLYPLAI